MIVNWENPLGNIIWHLFRAWKCISPWASSPTLKPYPEQYLKTKTTSRHHHFRKLSGTILWCWDRHTLWPNNLISNYRARGTLTCAWWDKRQDASASLFLTEKGWKQWKCPSTGEWLTHDTVTQLNIMQILHFFKSTYINRDKISKAYYSIKIQTEKNNLKKYKNTILFKKFLSFI